MSHSNAADLLCVPVRCGWRLEKPFQFRAVGKILISHQEGAGERLFLSALELRLNHESCIDISNIGNQAFAPIVNTLYLKQ